VSSSGGIERDLQEEACGGKATMLHCSTGLGIIADAMIPCNNFPVPSVAVRTRGALPDPPFHWSDTPAAPTEFMNGIHLLGEWFECPPSPAMHVADALRDLCVDATRAAGLTPVGERFHQFDPQGITGVVLLAESHLAIHTWPESGFVSIDVYVCNLSSDNSTRAQALYDALKTALAPAEARQHVVRRGRRPDGS
jgi:S-adenosylmethionine decarboxylase